ncbi:Serine/threonine protein phosphatase PrpC [Nocardioides terrae]|uniref:Serine/threonine protein phosphatase PrpC n=1 Tax=Nocardioides terrae TaxID=574651 RepID=A0A1I1JA59_9ACTN|nr:PP2C family serine/threonine-protein phosphatase [Nocardioides terrae]SFC44872.1 Serine/threonine protein phosphatase PrpC [Nocardioides terrae]
MTAAGWRAASASERGSSHRDGTPNQDAVGFTRAVDADGDEVWLAAVSDGHGGRRYVRSDIGARLAVRCALDVLCEVVPDPSWLTVGAMDGLLRDAMPRVVDAWRLAVLADLAERPFTDLEAERAGADALDTEPLLAYGATLIAAVIGSAAIAVAQIGDGDVLVRASGFAMRPVPGDDRLVAGETTSLCLESAVSDFRFATLPASAEPDLVLLASDGYGNSFASTDWWHGLVDDLALFVDENGFDSFNGHFSSWLSESAAIGGDDVSSVVLVREPLLVGPAGRAVSPAPAPVSRPYVPPSQDFASPPRRTLLDDDPPLAPVRRRAPTRLWLAAAAVAAMIVVAGAVVGAALLRDDGEGGPVSPATTSSVPTPAASQEPAPAAPTTRNPGDRHLSPPSGPGTKVVPDKKHPTKKQRR